MASRLLRPAGVWLLALVAIVSMVAVTTTVPADASLLERLPLETLQARAGAIVVGHVLSSRTIIDGRAMSTETRLAVDRSFRGPGSGILTIRTRGGVVRGRRLTVAGTPTFQPGEKVLVFLFRRGDAWRPVGMFQGVWRLDAADAVMARPSSPGGASLVDLRPGPYAFDGGPRAVVELVGAPGGAR